jgi:RNA polymerase sporulation-specific sigma factor
VSLLRDYRGLAIAISREYRFPGSDRQDVEQEAMIGLWLAVRDYRPELGFFAPFARLCVRRRLDSCLKLAQRKKHQPLNQAEETDLRSRAVLMHSFDPAEILEQKEHALELMRRVREDLTPLERSCWIGIANGKTYREIHEEVGGSKTSNGHKTRYRRIDNAMQRAHQKLAA